MKTDIIGVPLLAARRGATAPGLSICGDARLLRADEGAHELVADLGRDCINIDALACQEFAGVFYVVDARRLNADCLESGRREPLPVVIFVERAGNAADPKQHIAADRLRNCAACHHVRNSETAAGLQDAERLAQHFILVRGEIDNAV